MFEVAYYALEQCSKILPSYLLSIIIIITSLAVCSTICSSYYIATVLAIPKWPDVISEWHVVTILVCSF